MQKPRGLAEHTGMEVSNALPSPLGGVRVLVVDDHPQVLNVFRLVLEHSGAMVSTATCARDALASFLAHDVDVVVSDLQMPGEDGLWLARRLRDVMRRSGRSVPIVGISGDPEGEKAQDAMLGGDFFACLEKPVLPQQLCAAVARAGAA